MIYADGTVINGDFFNGQGINGKIIQQNGTTYSGPIKNKKPNGNGTVVRTNGVTFSANFRNGQIDSSGVLKVPHEEIVIMGDFVDFQPHGKVRIQYRNKEVYHGEVKKGLYHGLGIVSCPNSIYFACQFKNNLEAGFGILKDSQGKIIYGVFDGTNESVHEEFGDYSFPKPVEELS